MSRIIDLKISNPSNTFRGHFCHFWPFWRSQKQSESAKMDRIGHLQYTETKSCLLRTTVEFARFQTRFLILVLFWLLQKGQKWPKWPLNVLYNAPMRLNSIHKSKKSAVNSQNWQFVSLFWSISALFDSFWLLSEVF